MASSTTSSLEQWYLKAAIIVACSVLGYLVYDAIMSTAAELLQRLLIISPLLLVFLVHLLSTPNQVSISVPGSEPDAIYGAGGSPWGIAMLLLLLYFLIMYQPSFNALVFYIFMTIVTLRVVLY
ncbi:hypothetical protein DCAR_0728261 [Daucus carota subsp. sativus]|uniref:Uncharacterized protein n=1 Tax=Daucus carota subsp. sativus TaxID=79200 RepID=A0A164T939_DAUCS|nr:hypothetical protein DCAR_0728261 [Daucus carota subsp. sativus]